MPVDWNRYAYVRGNPVQYSDPSGHCAENGDEACWSQYEQLIRVCPGCTHYRTAQGADIPLGQLNYAQLDNLVQGFTGEYRPLIESGRTIPEGTLSIGVGGAAFAGIGVRGGAEIAFDTEGNFAILAGGGGGGYAAIGFNNIGPNVKITNAPTVDKLSGLSTQFGGSLGEVASIGAEWVPFRDEQGIQYHGLNVSGGAALEGPLPGEIHLTMEYDWMLFKINLPEVINKLSR